MVDKRLLVFGEKVIFALDIETLRIKRIRSPAMGIRGPVFVDSDSVQWADGKASWSYHFAKKKFRREYLLKGMKSEDIVYHSKNSGGTLIARGSFILFNDNKDKKSLPKIVHKDTAKFTKSFIDSAENVYFVSKNVVLRFDPYGSLIQAIPATNRNEIVASSINDRYHSYLLGRNGELEVFDLNNKVVKVFRLSKAGSASVIKLKPRFVTLISKGLPQVYHIKTL